MFGTVPNLTHMFSGLAQILVVVLCGNGSNNDFGSNVFSGLAQNLVGTLCGNHADSELTPFNLDPEVPMIAKSHSKTLRYACACRIVIIVMLYFIIVLRINLSHNFEHKTSFPNT